MSNLPPSTRREFLQGKPALDALAELTDAEDGSGDLPAVPGERCLLHLSRRAMACNFELFFNAGQYPHDTALGVAALDLVDRLEQQLSVYRQDSEVSDINRRASIEEVPVEAQLFELLKTAKQIHQESAGAYDITTGQLSRAWGFAVRVGTIPPAGQLEAAMERVGSQHVRLDDETRSVRFLVPGIELNLGSIGKGYALDRAAELLAAAGMDDFLLHGGNSSVLGRGARQVFPPESGWQVGVRHPLRPSRRLGHLLLRDRALATSGSGTQFFVQNGKRYGHILDPRTGSPAEGVLSVTVLAPTATEADALSTAFYVLGPKQAEKYCTVHPDIAALMLCPGERPGSMEVHRFNLQDEEWVASDEP